jgi:hypothetical protein
MTSRAGRTIAVGLTVGVGVAFGDGLAAAVRVGALEVVTDELGPAELGESAADETGADEETGADAGDEPAERAGDGDASVFDEEWPLELLGLADDDFRSECTM